jgi:WD40 repeat protein
MFSRLGYDHVLQELSEDPTQEQISRRLSEWLRDSERSSDDIVVIYYTGHGAIEMGRHYLLATDSAVNNLIGTAFPAENIVFMLASSPIQHLLVILDTCYAGIGISDLTTVAAELTGARFIHEAHGSGLWFIAAARPWDEAEQNVFADALLRALETAKAGQRQRYIHPGEIIDSVNRDLKDRGRQQRARYNVGDSSGLPLFFTNPRYDPLLPTGIDLDTQRRLREQDRLEHFSPRSRGVEFDSEPGWYFSGRDQIMQDLIDWILDSRTDHRARIITGSPGCGKSAILARLVMLSDGLYRGKAPLDHVPPTSVPPVGIVDVAVHLRNKSLEEVVAAIGAVAGTEALDPVALAQALSARVRPLVVVVDGLDEAGGSTNSGPQQNSESQRIARQLLKLLSGLPSVRLVIGTRPELVPCLGQSVKVIAVDQAEVVASSEISGYVYRILTATGVPGKTTPFQRDLELTVKVADAVAKRAYPNFLVARIVANNLLTTNVTPESYGDSWVSADFPEAVGDAFRDYLERFGSNEWRVRRLLTPLVYAEGAGLPWDNLWAPLAAAISGEFSSDLDIDWLLSNAGAYIVESIEYGRSVYRLHHQALADYLRRPQRDVDIQVRITRTLLDQVPVNPITGKKSWYLAHPYIRAYLATHAAAAGLLDDLVSQPDFLLVSNPERLLKSLNTLTTESGERYARAYRRAYSMLISRQPWEHVSYLELAAYCTGADDLAAELGQSHRSGRPWRVRWASWQLVGSYRILGSHHGGARDLTVSKVGDRIVAISGGWDNAIRVWDIHDGGQISECIGHTAGVRAVAVGALKGADVVASGGADGTFRVWDFSTGTLLFPPIVAHEGDIRCIRSGIYQDKVIFASAGNDGLIRLWVVAEGRLDCLRILDHGAWVNMVAFYESEGCTYVASGGDDNLIQVWAVETGEQVARLEGHTGGVYALAAAKLAERAILVSGSWDTSIRFWDPELGVEVRPAILDHEGPVMTVAYVTVGGRPMIASGGWDCEIRFWEIETGREIYAPLRGHDDGVMGLADCEIDGRGMLVSASWDSSVRIWDGYSNESRDIESGHRGGLVAVSVVADRQDNVIITGGRDAVLRMRDAATGRPIGRTGTSPAGPVSALHMSRIGEEVVAVSGCWDGSVHVWSPWELARAPRSFTAHDGPICAVLLLGADMGEYIATAGGDHKLKIWSLGTMELYSEYLGHDGWVTCVDTLQLNDRTVIISGSADQTIRIWDLAPNCEATDPLLVCHSPITALQAGRLDGQDIIVFGCEDGTVGAIHRPAEPEQRVLLRRHHEGAVTSVATLGDESSIRIVSGSIDHTVNVSVGDLDGIDLRTRVIIDLGCAVSDLSVVTADEFVVASSMGLACLDLNINATTGPPIR